MKKFLRNFCLVTTVLLLLLTVFGCSGSSYEFDFENASTEKIKGFSKYNYAAEYQSDTKNTEFEIVSGVSSYGKCLKITSKNVNDARIYKKISVKPEKLYLISYLVKTENVDGGNGANVSAVDAQGFAGSTFGTVDWTEVKVCLETQKDQKSVSLALGLGGYGNVAKGVAYFDNLKIEEVAEVPQGLSTFKITPNSQNEEAASNEVSIWFKLIFIAVLFGMLFYTLFMSFKADDFSHKAGRSLSHEKTVLDKKDLIIILAITLFTGLISFINLGSFKGSPESFWKPEAEGEYIEVSFEEETKVDKVTFYTGIARGNGVSEVQYLNENGEFVTSLKITNDDIDFYKWHSKSTGFTAKTVRIYVSSPGLWINEIGFFKSTENGFTQIKLDEGSIKASYTETETSGRAECLFDEQSDVCENNQLMNGTYFDEIYFPRTAYESIHGLSIYERTHPPLGKNLMALGILIFGMNTFSWRFMGTLFGVALVPLIYLFARKVFGKKEWALATAALMMFDCMRLAQTRLATIDSYSCFFAVLMLYFMYDYFVQKSYEKKFFESLVPLVFSGIAFGLGASSKWTCIYTGGSLAIIFFIAKISEFRDVKAGRTKLTVKKYLTSNFIPTCIACILLFVIVPAAIYVLNYLPYMPSNPDKSLLEVVIDNQKYMYNYHSGLTADHPYGSKWYTWPLVIRPIWYYVDNSVPEGLRSTIVSLGNPAIWWIGIPCIFAGSYMAWRNRDKSMAFFLTAYVMQYAPWFLINRVCFIYHYFTALPFTLFFIVYVLKEIVERKVLPKWTVFAYLGIVALIFALFYPALTGLTVQDSYITGLRWFSTWYF